jgi:hypothetical protein
MHRVKTAKRAILVAAILGIASAVAAGGYWVGVHLQPDHTAASCEPIANWWEIANPIFRRPLDTHESLLMRMEYVYDAPEDASTHAHGDDNRRFRPNGIIQYGVGAEAQQIEEWLREPQFGDASHALRVEEKYRFGRPLFSFSAAEVGAELQEGAVPESLRALFHAHGETLSEQATLIDADGEWWISDGVIYILRPEGGVFRVYGEPRKGNPRLVEQWIPVDWKPHSFRVPLPAGTRPNWCEVMRLRATRTPSGAKQTQQVEVAYLHWFPDGGWQVRKAASYKRDAGNGLSELQFRFEEPTEITSETNWVIVAWFSVDAPRGERPYNQFLIVGTLSGRFVSPRGAVVLNAGEAACVGLVYQPNERFPQVKVLRPAELRVHQAQGTLRWEASLTADCELLEVQFYVQPRKSRHLWEHKHDSIDLSASWNWAPQRAIWLPDF